MEELAGIKFSAFVSCAAVSVLGFGDSLDSIGSPASKLVFAETRTGGVLRAGGAVSFRLKNERSPPAFLTSPTVSALGCVVSSLTGVLRIPHPSATGLTYFFTDSSHDVDPRVT